ARASSRTLSPRNSSRSYEDARSGAHELCVKTFSNRSSGSFPMSFVSSPGRPAGARLLVRRDVVDSLSDGLDLLRILVRDLDPELVFQLHDQLHEIERVGVEVLLERGIFRDLVLVDTELFRQDFLDPLEHFLA